MYNQLTSDFSASRNPDIDHRMQLVVLGELPELAADLRHLGTGRPQQFEEFLSGVQDVLQSFTAEDERRRSTAHLAGFISQRDLHQLAKDKCASGTLIPSLDWLALQFQPKTLQSHRARCYTGRLDVRYCLQARQLRSAHEDDHYCLALFRMLREMCFHYRSFSAAVCLDDKAKVPIGEPGQPMSTGVRSRQSLTFGPAPLALDDDQASKGSFTPSIVLKVDLPSSAGGSTFYKGELHVLLKDSVLQVSNPFRHAIELCSILNKEGSCPPLLFSYTDGGSDHRTTFRSVQLAWILLFAELDLDMLVAARTAPGHSYVNPAERCMSTLNIALQNCALTREDIADQHASKRVRACHTMDALRREQPPVQEA